MKCEELGVENQLGRDLHNYVQQRTATGGNHGHQIKQEEQLSGLEKSLSKSKLVGDLYLPGHSNQLN